jgi:hypothetical protein
VLKLLKARRHTLWLTFSALIRRHVLALPAASPYIMESHKKHKIRPSRNCLHIFLLLISLNPAPPLTFSSLFFSKTKYFSFAGFFWCMLYGAQTQHREKKIIFYRFQYFTLVGIISICMQARTKKSFYAYIY